MKPYLQEPKNKSIHKLFVRCQDLTKINKRTKETGDINYINGMKLLYLKKGQPKRKLYWYFNKLKVHNEEWLSVQARNE